MAYQLRIATEADIVAMREVYFNAFAEDEISRRVFPASSRHAQNFWLESIRAEMHDPQSHFLVVVEKTDQVTSSPSEKVVGFAKWVSPESKASTYIAPPQLPWPEDGDVALGEQFFSTIAKNHKELMGGRPHWFLELLGVRREAQGKGVASMLLRWGLERADEDGLEVYLDGSPAGAPIYRHFGFEDAGMFSAAGGEHNEVSMIRKAQLKK